MPREAVRRILKKCHVNLDAVEFFLHPTDRSWTRDFCPIFVKNKARRSGDHALALQRLGEVFELAQRCARRRRTLPRSSV